MVAIFLYGATFGVLATQVISWFFGSRQIYRRWYLMVRNELERIDPHNEILKKIGLRVSKREPWEKG